MRPIKYKIWNKEEKVFTGPFTLNQLIFNGHPITKDQEIVIFTGLHDKNGNEIYEGDIIKYEEINYKIIFSEGSFNSYTDNNGIIHDVAPQCDEYPLKYVYFECEIIGNIHENGDLL